MFFGIDPEVVFLTFTILLNYLSTKCSCWYFFLFGANLIGLALPSSKLSWKFNKLLNFAVSNAKTKCFVSVGFSESLNIMFIHLDSPFIFFQSLISLMLITPILLFSFPFIKESLVQLSLLQIKKITFVSCTTNELINKLLIIKWYL